MRTTQVTGMNEVVADFRGAAKTAPLRASVKMTKHGKIALARARATVPTKFGDTKRSLVLTRAGTDERPVFGDVDMEVGSLRSVGRGLSAAGWLTHGTSRRGPQWDFYGVAEAALSGLYRDLEKLAGDV